MVCFLRCAVVADDIRLYKYIEACKVNGIQFMAVTWDRLKEGKTQSFEIPFKKKSRYGRGWINAGNKLLWQFYQVYVLIKKRNEYKLIHACDFDTMIPALLMKFFFKKKVIYDIYDAFSQRRPVGVIAKIIRYCDVRFFRYCDMLILADEARIQQMGINFLLQNKIFIVENVPALGGRENFEESILDNYIYLSYVGVFDHYRGLEDLLSCVQDIPYVYLNIAGTGKLLEQVVRAAQSCDRIHYWGSVNYKQGIEIMSCSHIIVGMYYPDILNHIYAAPNKYFESLFLAKPLLTTQGTLVGSKTIKYNTGYAIKPDKKSLYNFIENSRFLIKGKAYNIKKQNAKDLWKNNYENYFNQKIVNDYVSKMRGLL